MGGGGRGTRHCTATPNNCFNEDCGALCVATPCLIDRCHLIRDDQGRIVAILTSKSKRSHDEVFTSMMI